MKISATSIFTWRSYSKYVKLKVEKIYVVFLFLWFHDNIIALVTWLLFEHSHCITHHIIYICICIYTYTYLGFQIQYESWTCTIKTAFQKVSHVFSLSFSISLDVFSISCNCSVIMNIGCRLKLCLVSLKCLTRGMALVSLTSFPLLFIFFLSVSSNQLSQVLVFAES